MNNRHSVTYPKRPAWALPAAIIGLLLASAVCAGSLLAQSDLPGSGWKTGQQIQNVGDSDAEIKFLVYSGAGTSFDCGIESAAPGASVNYLTEVHCPAPAGFAGSGVVLADQPIVGVAHVNNAGAGAAGGIYTAAAEEDVDETIFFPLVKHNHVGRTTSFHLQNASVDPNDITATFRVKGIAYTKDFQDVPAYSMVVLSPGDAGVPGGNGQVGSLTVVGTGPLAGTSLEYEGAAAVAQNLQASRAFTAADYDDTLYCPLYRNAHTALKLTTGAQVQNVSAAAQTVTFTYRPGNGGPPITKSETIQPGASATFYAPFLGLPQNTVGSATITGSDNLVAVVNDEGTENGQRRTTTYACFPASRATARVVLPLYKEFWIGNTSGIQIQNVSADGTAATVTVTYRATNGGQTVVLSHGNPVADGGSITFFAPSQGIAPPGVTVLSGDPATLMTTYGSVEITSNTPIVAIANESSYGAGASGHDSKNYEGFNR